MGHNREDVQAAELRLLKVGVRPPFMSSTVRFCCEEIVEQRSAATDPTTAQAAARRARIAVEGERPDSPPQQGVGRAGAVILARRFQRAFDPGPRR